MNNSDSKSKIEEPVDTNAKATIVAFTFQFERALFRLFSSHQANIRVGIETLDDVAELSLQHDGAVQATLEQDANTVQSDGHPFQDSSRKLWHTLRIWLSHVDKLRAEYQEVAFCMVTNATVPAAALVQRLALAMAPKEVTQCVELVRQHAIRLSKDAKAKAKADASIVARYADDDIAYLIRNLFLLHEGGAGSGVAPREATIQLFQLHSGIADQGVAIYQSILGAAVDKCQSAWRNQKTAWFSPQEFRDKLREEVMRRSLDKYLDRDMMSTNFRDYVKADGRDHFFLTQLSRLGLPPRFVDMHLDNFWAFYCERVRLEEEGVNTKDWSSREDELHQRWKVCQFNAELELMSQPGCSPEARGQLVLAKTLSADYKAPLGGYPTNHLYFTQGHYHSLANKPLEPCFVYWHPSFGEEDASGEGGAS